MTNLWMLNSGFPLMVLGVRLMIIRNSLRRASRAAEASPEHKEILSRLHVPWREGILLTAGGFIVLVVGLIYYLSLSHPAGWAIVNAGALLVILGIGQFIQARAQRLPEPERLKSESLIHAGAWFATVVGFAFIITYVVKTVLPV